MTSTEEQTRQIVEILRDSLEKYEIETGESFCDMAVYNASITMVYQILYYSYGDDVKGIREALDSSVQAVLDQIRKHNLSVVEEVIEKLDPNQHASDAFEGFTYGDQKDNETK